MNNNKEILEISIEDIIPNRFQPRLTFDVEALNELANSIREHGIIQPLVVRRLQDKFEIIAGERRYKAATLVGMQKVPCIVMELNDNESAEVAVIENIQRKEMTPLEEAKSFKKILDKGYLTQDELARKMGKSQSSIANKLRLLNLDELVQDAILNNKISERHARSILKITSKEDQRKILTEIIEKRLTVKQTDDLINERFGGDNLNTENIFKSDDIIDDNISNISSNIPNNNVFSSPEVNLPTPTINNNPQSNIMNGMQDLSINNNQNIVETQKTQTDIFKYDLPSTTNLTQKEQEIKEIIKPSVFSDENNQNNPPTNNITYPNLNVDINNIKMNAEDINKPVPSANINSLLDDSQIKRENKFFVDLNLPTNNINTTLNQNNLENTLKIINEKVSEIKNSGVNLVKEERDLGTSYEIIIRIKK